MESNSGIEEVGSQRRRSSRCNKGIPPRKFSEFVMDKRPDLNVPTTSVVAARVQKGDMALSRRQISENNLLERVGTSFENAGSVRRETRSDVVFRNTSMRIPSIPSQKGSEFSNRSEVSKLNLELDMLRMQKQLDEEEAAEKQKIAEEKLKAIEKKRENLEKEMVIQKKLLEKADSRSGSQVDNSGSLYGSSTFLNKWVDDAKKCVTIDSRHSDRENGSKSKQIRDASQFSDQVDSLFCQYSDGIRQCGKADSNFMNDVTKLCMENTAAMNKLLIRQKIRDLSHFSGELTDWPIFISEFKRTTELYSLTDEENLLRLDRALKGKARETVNTLLISPVNVGRIIKMLEMNFGRAEWIVLSLMEKAKKMSSIKDDKLESYIAFSNTVTNMVSSMKNASCGVYLFNPEMLSNLVDKLPLIQRYGWGKNKNALENQGQQVSLDDFSSWLEEEVNLMASISNPFAARSSNTRKETVMISKRKPTDREEEAAICLFCKKSNHSNSECGDFIKKPIEERRSTALELKICFICLKPGHMASRCSHQRSRCGENGCRGKHHKLLHIDKVPVVKRETSSNLDTCANLTSADQTVLLRVAPVKLHGPAEEIIVFALFDEGSTCSMIEQELADRLELSGTITPFCYQWTNGITHHEDESRIVSLEIAAVNTSSGVYRMKQVRTVDNLCLPVQQIDVEEICTKYPYLNRDILESIKSIKPQLLIGQDNCGLIIPRQIIQPRINAPIMSKAKLGWTIHGAIDFNGSNDTAHISLCCQTVQDEELHILVKDTFRLESFGVKLQDGLIRSVEDKRAVTLMEKTLTRIEGRYEIGHLWKKDQDILPDSRPNAMKRLLCMERKMEKNEEFSRKYCDKIVEYVNKGYARKLRDDEIMDTPKTWYLPHFAVWNVNKPQKFRLVFDAAARSHGSSLNDFLLQGPDFVPSLVSVLWRFRQGRVAINGDIREMFHQVVIKEDDRSAQRFLWRGTDRNKVPDVYQMNVMIFGAISSPSVAQFVKNKNAEKFESQYPGILRIMKRQHYVDDYLDSCNSEEEAIDRVKSVIHVHSQGGFEMTKWISNSEKVISSIPENLRATVQDNNLVIDSQNIERVLGLSWSSRDDNFIFSLNLKNIPLEITHGIKTPTKREVLRMIMSIFDPLGFLAPLMIKARLLMQEIWKSNIDWDMEIVESLFVLWTLWLGELQEQSPIVVPRYYFPQNGQNDTVKEVDLHLFCDASDKAYAAVAYLRLEVEGRIYTSFVTSKFKVAPLNQQTIPKLELQAAVLASRLAKTIKNELDYTVNEIHFWTDSLVVLKQIRSQSRRFPMFVACRIGEIHEDTDVSQWHWVPSDSNVADQATKVLKNLNLKVDGSWLNGPTFLQQSIEFWPIEPYDHRGIEEEHVCLILTAETDTILPDIQRFSKWIRLVRATAWIFYVKNVIRLPKTDRPITPTLDVKLIDEACRSWVKKSQSESFAEELHQLHHNKIIKKSSRLLKLSVFLDEYKIIRVGGRFSNEADIEYDAKYPIVLDPKCRYTQLVVDHFHMESGHFGIETVVNNLRLKYWILHARATVKKSFRRCQLCRIRNAKPMPPIMGNLPVERFESTLFPFTYVGIDYFGPMHVSIGRRTEKRYGVLFTCLTVRAVHIELAATLDTSSAIMAIRRFMCRRGQPKEFLSDNGTNFVGAERELREWRNSLDHQRISDDLSSKGIVWKFNPPGAASMGGIWERMVRAFKTALKISLKSRNPKEEVLLTLLCEAEYMINSRPLTHISVDPTEPEAITPNHFLLLRPGGVRSYGKNEVLSRKQWRSAQALADCYWKRWVREYRPTLLQRQKWHSKTEPIKVGDVTIMVDEKMARNEWLLGKVEQVYPGKDGVIRVAQIKTKNGFYTRPVSKLCILPTSSTCLNPT